MPKVERIDPEFEAHVAAWNAFTDERAWRRSRKGNLWRNWDGLTLTIYRRTGDEYFGWCVAGADDDRRFSSGGYESEAEAMGALGSEVGVGG